MGPEKLEIGIEITIYNLLASVVSGIIPPEFHEHVASGPLGSVTASTTSARMHILRTTEITRMNRATRKISKSIPSIGIGHLTTLAAYLA